MRLRGRSDNNQQKIIEALRKSGCFVQVLSAVGNGCPDLLVSRAGQWNVLEVKNGKLPPSHRRLTEDELDWHSKAGAPVHVVLDAGEALKAVGL